MMTQLLTILALIHMNNMHHQLIMRGDIMQENMGKYFRNIITKGLQSRHWEDTCRNWTKYFSNTFIWTSVHFNPLIFVPGWTCCSQWICWSKICWFIFALYIQCKNIIFWNSITKNHASMSGQKILLTGSRLHCTPKSQLQLVIFLNPNSILRELVFPWFFLHTFYFLQKS